jgi:cytochrome b6-f complex iron-sulfur subunit
MLHGAMNEPTPSRLSRRSALSLLAAGVVAVCAGCSGDDDGPGSAAGASVPPTVGAEAFGTVIDVGTLGSLFPAGRTQSWAYAAAARTYLVRYPLDKVAAAKTVYPEVLHVGLDAGLLAIYQRCTHIGCRVLPCESSGMFECPCHAGMFSAYGEWRAGPPPSGMDLFAIQFRDDRIHIDTSQVVPGLGKSVDVTQQRARGPHCIKSP